ncbi:MAG: TRAP transporter substrate-binding protein DctP [Anaerotruncus sp.]|nr:TRAP transporter substrate-binding protein DctP [Anaerotruncus sp.]
MKPDSQVYLNCVKYLSEFIPCPVAFFNLEGQVLACTHPIRNSFAQMVVQQCLAAPEQCQQIANSYGAQYAVLDGEGGTPLCIVLFMEAVGHDGLLAPVRTLLLLILQEQTLHSQLFFESNEHLSFVREILFSNDYQSETLREQAIKRQYPLSAYRVVMLFDPVTDTTLPSERTEPFVANKKELFSKAVTMAPGYHFDDILDFLNLKRVVLLKMVPPELSDFPQEYLYTFAQAVITMLKRMDATNFRVSIGSCYYELAEIRNSYTEACFVANNFEFFDTAERNILFATDYIADYLFSLLPDSYYREKFVPLNPLARSRSNLPETLACLSQHNMNFQQTAKAMQLHRNTLLQRYGKICAQAKFNPIKNSHDRVSARQYALFCRCKTVIRAGTMIRGNNILSILYDKLAERISKNSQNTIRLELQTLGLSGNNFLILDMLKQGEIDLGVGQAGMLLPLLGDKISIVDAPFLFRSPQQAIRLLNGAVGREMLAPLRDSGFYGLAFWSMGWRYLTCGKAQQIRLPQDLSGQRIRIMCKPLLAAFMRYLGAEPYYISYDKLTAAIQDTLVDVQENPYQNFYDMNLYQSHKNLFELNMLFDSNTLLTSTQFWSRFSASQQEIIAQSVQETVQWNSDCFYSLTAATKKSIAQEGVSINTPTAKELSAWQKAAQEFLLTSSYRQIYLDFVQKSIACGGYRNESSDV